MSWLNDELEVYNAIARHVLGNAAVIVTFTPPETTISVAELEHVYHADDLTRTGADGVCHYEPDGSYWIEISPLIESPERRDFVLLHELGHVVDRETILRTRAARNVTPDDLEPVESDDEHLELCRQHERRANNWADTWQEFGRKMCAAHGIEATPEAVLTALMMWPSEEFWQQFDAEITQND